MATKQQIGRRGEEAAVRHLQRRGFEILDRNWRTRTGELDIVALRGGMLVFVEVKTRTGIGFGLPAEAVTREKIGRLRQVAGQWLRAHGTSTTSIRLDVIAVGLHPESGCRITHYEGIDR